MALSRAKRVPSGRTFTGLQRGGKVLVGRVATIRYQKNQSTGIRLTIVISGRVVGSAVKRNRLRRQLSEWLHSRLTASTSALDMIIHLRSGVINLSIEQIRKSLEEILKQANIV
ncbi:MAG TPA: ribonuclease P protein component [Candidatus Paceibacterota bacterium]|nr:ribonuclease P protein component [Candidatus Paceibacterota bacterium]